MFHEKRATPVLAITPVCDVLAVRRDGCPAIDARISNALDRHPFARRRRNWRGCNRRVAAKPQPRKNGYYRHHGQYAKGDNKNCTPARRGGRRCRERRGHNTSRLLARYCPHIAHEAIAALWHRNDEFILLGFAEGLAKVKNVMRKICFLDKAVRPHAVEYLFLGNDAAGVFDKNKENIESLGFIAIGTSLLKNSPRAASSLNPANS